MRLILRISGRLVRLRVQQAWVQLVVFVLLGTHYMHRKFASEAANLSQTAPYPRSDMMCGSIVSPDSSTQREHFSTNTGLSQTPLLGLNKSNSMQRFLL